MKIDYKKFAETMIATGPAIEKLYQIYKLEEKEEITHPKTLEICKMLHAGIMMTFVEFVNNEEGNDFVKDYLAEWHTPDFPKIVRFQYIAEKHQIIFSLPIQNISFTIPCDSKYLVKKS